MEKKSNILNQKFSIVNEAISNQNIIKERISILELFRLKTDETLVTYDCKFKNLDKEFHNAVTKYDKIILDSIVYPGVIGKTSQFKTFHDLIDFLILNINKLIFAKERETIEFNENKNKLEELYKSFQGRIDFYLNNVNEFTRKMIKHSEKEIYEKIDNLIKEFSDNKIDFIQKFNSYENKIDKLTNNLMKSIDEITNELKIKIAEENIDLNSKLKLYDNKYDENSNEIDLMKQEIKNLKSMISDLLSKIDLNNKNNNNSINVNNNINIKNNIIDNSKTNNNIDDSKNNLVENSKNNINNICDNNINDKNFCDKNDIEKPFKINNNTFIKNDNKYNIDNQQTNINKDENIIIKNKEKENRVNNNNIYTFNANSIIKKYIEGVINLDDINQHYSNKSPKNSNEYNNKKIIKKVKMNEEDFKGKNINNEDILEDEESNNNIKSISVINSNNKFYENSSNQTNNGHITKNMKLYHNKKYSNFKNNFKSLDEELYNAKIKQVDLTIDENNNNINNNTNNNINQNIFPNINLLNIITDIKKKRSEIFNNNNLIYNKNNAINNFIIKNNLYESKQVQTPKSFQKIKSYIDSPLNNNNHYLSEERPLYDNKNSFNTKGIIKDKQINDNKNVEKKSNMIFKKIRKNNIYGGNKFKRLYSSINNKRSNATFNKIEVNFDETNFSENKEKEKFRNDIEQIKAVLPQNERQIFLQRVEKLGYRDIKINKKNKNDISYNNNNK